MKSQSLASSFGAVCRKGGNMKKLNDTKKLWKTVILAVFSLVFIILLTFAPNLISFMWCLVLGIAVITLLAFVFFKLSFNTKLIIITIVFIIISSIITYLVAFISTKTGQIAGSIGDWISFSGSITGGSITMLAVYFTIVNESNNRKRDEEIRIMPYMEVGLYGNGIDFDLQYPIEVSNSCDYPIRSLQVNTKVIIDNNEVKIPHNAIYQNFLSPRSKCTAQFSSELKDHVDELRKAMILIEYNFEFSNYISTKIYKHEACLYCEYEDGFFYTIKVENRFHV